MILGVSKGIKNNEYRVSVTPAGVRVFVKDGHPVIVERDARKGSGIRNKEYIEAGAVFHVIG
jgi:alanine dehydrogenase